MVILPTAYCGSIQYYSKLINFETVVDHHENYCKQSIRNRCVIMGANGPITLIVPILKEEGGRRATKDVRIDNSKAWQHEHWRSIFSAYGRSPYFFHFSELFEPIYRAPYNYLIDLNYDLHMAVYRSLGIELSLNISDSYVEASAEDIDFRSAISSKPRLKRPDPDFVAPQYFQVFSEKMPFVENASILDLLFCEGREAVNMLCTQSVRQSALTCKF